MAPAAKSRSDGERLAIGPRVLDLLASGRSVDNIAAARRCTRARVEKILRAELEALSIRPTPHYAKLQIRRLEAMVEKLVAKANAGDLAAVDRILKISDRLDRYHGFAKLPPTGSQSADQAYEELMNKLSGLIARRERANQQA